jgi:transposase
MGSSSDAPATTRAIKPFNTLLFMPAILREELVRRVILDLLPISMAADEFNVSPTTAAKWVRRFQQGGCHGLLDRSSRPHRSPRRLTPDRSDDDCKALLVSVLHRPPSEFGINRSSWRIADLHSVIREQGLPLSEVRMRRVIAMTGFKWRKARVVLTSWDPDYAQKVESIKAILSNIRSDEVFFSIDEYGPFSIKKKGGRKRVAPYQNYVVPQWQVSKGWLILTSALELSTNQVTHFYSRRKNTDEMIRMADLLRSQYANRRRIYLSWDAASWHVSKNLKAHLEKLNRDAAEDYPIVEIAPLPAGAQFLDVIESVFSGMARGIIHNSDYSSMEAAMASIDQYFQIRNEHFRAAPSRAGKKIWQRERVECEFSEINNCKDPLYR